MEPTTVMVLVVVGVVALAVVALISRVFIKLLKVAIFAIIIAVLAGFIWTQVKPRLSQVGQATPTPVPERRAR